jgi:hypothetical protein
LISIAGLFSCDFQTGKNSLAWTQVLGKDIKMLLKLTFVVQFFYLKIRRSFATRSSCSKEIVYCPDSKIFPWSYLLQLLFFKETLLPMSAKWSRTFRREQPYRRHYQKRRRHDLSCFPKILCIWVSNLYKNLLPLLN